MPQSTPLTQRSVLVESGFEDIEIGCLEDEGISGIGDRDFATGVAAETVRFRIAGLDTDEECKAGVSCFINPALGITDGAAALVTGALVTKIDVPAASCLVSN